MRDPTRLQLEEIDFIERSFRLRGKPLILDDYQKQILLTKNKFKMINKARKVGITTLVAADALFKCMKYGQFLGLIISKDERASKYVLSFVDQLLMSYPKAITDIFVDEESKTEIKFVNGSVLMCLPCGPNAARGYDPDEIWVDEFAFFNEHEKDTDIMFLATALPALAIKKGGITFISTPNGKKGQFFSMWHEEPSEYTKIIIHWSQCKRLFSMIDKIKAGLPQPKELWFRQEFCNSFEENLQGFIERELLLINIDDKLVLDAV